MESVSAVMGDGATVALNGGAAAPAVFAGIAVGLAADGVITGVDRLTKKKYRPYGYFAQGELIKEKIEDGARAVFDNAMIPVADGMAGLAGNKMGKALEAKQAQRDLKANYERARGILNDPDFSAENPIWNKEMADMFKLTQQYNSLSTALFY